MANSINAGKVSMDLALNSKSFKKQLNDSVNDSVKSVSASTSNIVKSTFGLLGKIAAAAFSVKAITDFTKSCITLGSTLQEVQNVVDVTFGEMSAEVDTFAKSAIKNIGLSEATAKQYMGTFGAMAKSFGYSTKEALELSKTLTTLTGDVSSFYNIDSSAAYTKIKSVFTGETESLKDLGVVMTQTALDNYALEKGYGKTTKQMEEHEKVALRCKFVTEKLSAATGDFIRTQDGWANQTRVLSLQLDSFKANIGQGLIAAFTPIIKIINLLIEKLVQLSYVFKTTMERIFGKSSSESISSISGEMSALAGNAEGVGIATEDASNKIKRSLMAFDKLNILSDSNSNSSDSTSGISIPELNVDNAENENAESSINSLKNEIEETIKLFKDGFKDGLGNSSLNKTKENIGNIKKEIKGIINDKSVKNSAENLINSVLYNLGRTVGAAGSIGITVSENLTGGIEKNLNQKSPRIKDYIVKMFDVSSKKAEIAGKTAETVADIFSVFRSDDATSLTNNILGTFEEFGMSLSLLGNRIATGIVDTITTPIINNKEEIKGALGELIVATNKFAEGVNDTFTYVGDAVDTVCTEKIGPSLQRMRDLASEIVKNIVEGWRENISPVLIELGERFTVFVDEHIKPFVDAFMECIGNMYQGSACIYELVKPIIDWFVDSAFPILSTTIKTIANVVMEAVAILIDTITGLLKVISGIIDFVVGVFTGDWERAWTGVKNVFKGIMDAICSIVKGAFNIIKSIFSGIMDQISNSINGIVDGVNRVIKKVKGISIGGANVKVEANEVPKLAQGGYARANTPQLAVVGDNRREGEIIAPESKIREQVIIAMQPLLAAIQQLITVIQSGGSTGNGEIAIPIYIGNELIDTYIINLQNRQVLRTGGR